MAYSTGSFGGSDGFDVVMTKLATFANAQGWSIHNNTFPYLTLSKSDCFASLFFDQSQTVDDSQNTGAGAADYRIYGCLGSSYASISPLATQFKQQPGSLPLHYNVSSNEDNSYVNSNDWTGPYSQYWFFSGADGEADYIYMVVQKANGRFCYFGIGTVDKKGATYTGGGFMDGVYWNWWFDSVHGPNVGGNQGSTMGSDSQGNTQRWMGNQSDMSQVYLGDLGTVSPKVLGWDGQGPGKSDHIPLSPLMASSGKYNTDGGLAATMTPNTAYWLHPIFWLGPNPINGSTPLFEIPVFANARDVSRLFFVGSMPGKRWCSMINRLEAETLTFGDDSWLVFPMKRALPWSPEPYTTKTVTSGPYGHAFKINS